MTADSPAWKSAGRFDSESSAEPAASGGTLALYATALALTLAPQQQVPLVLHQAEAAASAAKPHAILAGPSRYHDLAAVAFADSTASRNDDLLAGGK
jgi:hypothetical protein